MPEWTKGGTDPRSEGDITFNDESCAKSYERGTPRGQGVGERARADVGPLGCLGFGGMRRGVSLRKYRRGQDEIKMSLDFYFTPFLFSRLTLERILPNPSTLGPHRARPYHRIERGQKRGKCGGRAGAGRAVAEGIKRKKTRKIHSNLRVFCVIPSRPPTKRGTPPPKALTTEGHTVPR